MTSSNAKTLYPEEDELRAVRKHHQLLLRSEWEHTREINHKYNTKEENKNLTRFNTLIFIKYQTVYNLIQLITKDLLL